MVSAGSPGSAPLGEDEASPCADGTTDDGSGAGGTVAGEAGAGPRSAPGVSVRPMLPSDCAAAARLHSRVLDAEFITRFGTGFLEAYYRAWVDADGGLALVATGASGDLEGQLLGAFDPVAHTASMVRGHWPSLATRLVLAATRDPRLGRDLVVTRALRYARGIVRAARRSPRPKPVPSPVLVSADRQPGTGEVTHLLVAPEAQGAGFGRQLVAAAEEAGRRAGLGELVLVTPVEDRGARSFYERIGWVLDRPVTSASGERFVRYRRPLGPG